MGCVTQQQARMQVQDEPPEQERYEPKTIADVTDTISNAEPLPVAGVGLVTGLNGTGSAARPSGWRSRLERELQRKNIRNVKAILEDKNNSLVLVTGMIPAGSHKGDAFDVEITLPQGSETTSLCGGHLEECVLLDYALIDGMGAADHPGQGLARGKASGPLLVELGDSIGQAGDHNDLADVGNRAARAQSGNGAARKARVYNGGHSLLERPFIVAMNRDNQQARVVAQVAERINETFHGPLGTGTNQELATPQRGERVSVVVAVPPQYKLNMARYLRVIRLIPLRERRKSDKENNPNAPAPNIPEMFTRYKRQLEQDLLDPAHTVTAALRLEALGSESVSSLKRGLDSSHVLVRFCAAEALAYLDCRTGVPELSRIVADQPNLRAYALTALASLDEGISVGYLQDLLGNPDAEARYGAFRALRSLDDKSYEGETFSQGFTIHHVAAGTTPLVHVSTSRRAEIVLFGDESQLVSDFSILAGNFVLASAPGDTRCTISHYVAGTSDRRQCSLKVDDIIHTMGRMNGQYGEVLEFLAQAYRIKSLTCDLRFDALPQAPSVQELAKAGVDAKHRMDLAHQGKTPESQDRTDEELFNARGDLAGTPSLFEKGGGFNRRLSAEQTNQDQASLDTPAQHR
jgi:hypothetical protein